MAGRDRRSADNMNQSASYLRRLGQLGTAAVKAVLPKEVKIAIAIAIAIILLFCIIAGGTNMPSMDKTFFMTAKNAEKVNAPEGTDIFSVYTNRQSVEQTVKLSSIIEEQKQKDRVKIEQELRREYAGSNVTIECDSDREPIFLTGFPDIDAAATSGGGTGSMGEHIAQTAERLAWPLGTPSSKYDWDTGGAPTPENKAAIEQYYPSQLANDCKKVGCCCHSARVIMAAALGKKLSGTLLPNVQGNDNAIKALQEVFKDCNYEVFKYDGKESSLKRGDLLTWAWKEPGGHTCIYIGDGKVVEGSLGEKYFSHVSDYKTLDVELSKYNYFVVSRSKDSGSGVTNGGVSTSAQQVIEGACLWAEAIANDDRFHYGYGRGSHQFGCYFCDTNKDLKYGDIKDIDFTYCCNPFVHAAFAHGGGVPEMLELCKNGGGYGMTPWSNKKDWEDVGRPAYENLVRGDVLVSEDHVALYIGDGKTCQAGSEDDNIKGSSSWNNSITADARWEGYQHVYRYIGNGGGVMEIPAGAGGVQRKKYDQLTTIETINQSDGTSIGLESGPYAYQSFAHDGSNFYFLRPPGGRTGVNGYIYKTDSSMRVLKETYGEPYGHGNGMTFCAQDAKLYSVSTTTASGTNKVVSVIDPITLKITDTININPGGSAISYDKETNKFVTTTALGDWKLNIFDSSLSSCEKTYRQLRTGGSPADICAYNGVVYIGRFLGVGNNYIDMYDENTGDYYGSYYLPYKEIEGIEVINGELVLLFHAENPFVQFTGIKVDSGISTEWNPNVVTMHDMDVLSAYAISLANSALEYHKEGPFKNLDAGILSFRYTDINGKPIKTYWLGEDAGQINYEKDLKSKVDNWTFYDREIMEISENGNNVKITIHETPAHKLIKRMFNVEPYAEYVNAQASTRPLTNEELAEVSETAAVDISTALSSSGADVDRSAWNLILVNNEDANAVPSSYDSNLTEIDPGDRLGITAGHDYCKEVNANIRESLVKMLSDCPSKAIVQSAYRPYDVQESLYNAAVAAGRNDTTRPGHSEHQTGLAVDIIDATSSGWSDPLVKKQEETAAQQWLMANCQNYGFILRYPEDKVSVTGIDYEPWHYRYVGVEHAKKIMESGLCLEEYIGGATAGSASTANATEDAAYSEAMKGKTTNAEAIYSLSETTANMLFIGMAKRNVALNSGSITIGGIDGFPLPQDSGWEYTSPFGQRWGRLHAGIDLGAPAGTPIYSTCDGTVTRASYAGGYGNSVVIQGSDGKEYIYGHMTEIMASPGPVIKGQQIGTVGNTGNSYGNHLHYEIKVNGVAVDPFPLFSKHLQDLMNSRKSADFG